MKKKKTPLHLFCFFCVLFQVLLCAPLPAKEILLDDKFSSISIKDDLPTLLEPENQRFSVYYLINKPEIFSSELYNDSQELGKETYWHRLVIKSQSSNNGKSSAYLIFQNPTISYLDVFLFKNKRLVSTKNLGVLNTTTQGESFYQGMIFEIPYEKNQTLEVLIRKQSGGAMILPMQLYAEKPFQKYLSHQYMFWGVVIGLLIIIAIYNTVIFMLVQNKSYVWYLVFYLVVFLHLSGTYGFGFLLWSDQFQQSLTRHLLELDFLLVWIMINFALVFLNAKKMAPMHYEKAKLIKHGAIIGIPLTFVIEKNILAPVFITYYCVSLLFCLSMALTSYKNKFIPARFYLLSWFFVLLGGILSLMAFSNYIPANFITINGFVIGVLIELLILSIALADRLKYTATNAMSRAFTDPQTNQPNYSFFINRFLQELPEMIKPRRKAVLILIKASGFRDSFTLLEKKAAEDVYQMQINRLESLLSIVNWSIPFSGPGSKPCYMIALPNDHILLLANKNKQKLEDIAYDLSQTTIEPIKFNKFEIKFDFNIGFAFCNLHTEKAETCYQHAQLALLNAESKQTCWSVYREEQGKDLKDKLELLFDLRKAVKNQDLEIYIQPQYSMHDSNLVGGEILVRWNHPEKGMISPELFIPLAEESGVVIEITKMMIDKSFSWISKRNLYKSEYHFSINLSAIDIQQAILVPYIRQKIESYRIPPSIITFEVTETAAMENQTQFLRVIQDLHDIGFKVAIDDFGKEYSSMRYLQQIKADIIKIDMSFIRDIHKSSVNKNIVKAIIQMAASINATTVAEGIETIEEYETLHQYNIDNVQGLLTGEAVSAEKFIDQYINASTANITS